MSSPSISIEGAVRAGTSLAAGDLKALPGQVADVAPLVAGRSGTAVRLASVLDAAGVDSSATYLTVESDDASFAASVPLDAVREAVIVYALDGKPLPREKGGPFRLLIPDAARCGGAEVDKCANVKNVGVLRLDVGHGHDTRPSTKADHAAMHRKPGHGHSE
ncbi:MAG TPA: molybdopterin-dependent oxidoreductase [Candidatus Limnocylindrales bacterium]|nr:molybdopterin-dependent oxidoreductase [Candidatus Limnocylindrales bacterium]